MRLSYFLEQFIQENQRIILNDCGIDVYIGTCGNLTYKIFKKYKDRYIFSIESTNLEGLTYMEVILND